MTTLLELAERCEAATGPDRELDKPIAQAVGWTHFFVQKDMWWRSPNGSSHGDPPRFSASLDAAMTLIDDTCVWGVSKQEHNPGRDYYYQASVMPFGPVPWSEAKAVTPALALCAAALRARASNSSPEGTRE